MNNTVKSTIPVNKENLFKIFFCSYITKTISFTSKEIQKKRNLLKQKEELLLNVVSVDFKEENVNLIMHTSNNSLNEVDMYIQSEDFKDIVENKKILIAINSLTKRQKEIIHKIIIENKKEIDIARELNISKQSVNKVKNTALNNIRKQLEVV